MKTILFDLDGTLLGMDAKAFETTYFGSLIHYYNGVESGVSIGKSLFEAVKVMIENQDSNCTNEDTFFTYFKQCVGQEVYDKVKLGMEDYYTRVFDCVKEITTQNVQLIQEVKNLKNKGYRVILATNPMLPKLATDKRIEWAGLQLSDFDHITRFEEYHYCKPNPEYYREIIKKCELDPKDCIMVGNDLQDDGIAKKLGMQVWIVNDYLIDRGQEMVIDWIGSQSELIAKLKTL